MLTAVSHRNCLASGKEHPARENARCTLYTSLKRFLAHALIVYDCFRRPKGGSFGGMNRGQHCLNAAVAMELVIDY
jgi:hypothetical protein